MSQPAWDKRAIEHLVMTCIQRSEKQGNPLGSLTLDTHLFEEAVLDSLGTMSFLAELEQAFGVHLTDGEVFSDNFATPRGIASLVAGHLGIR